MRRSHRTRSVARLTCWSAACLILSACGGTDDPTTVESPTLSVSTTSLPGGTDGVDYGTESLAATGGDGSYTWALAAGTLPDGLGLASSGEITGVPSGFGSTFTVEVESGDGQVASAELAIDVEFTWNLTEEWSDAANPFGPWALYADDGQLFTVSHADYFDDGTNQAGWAAVQSPQQAHVPLWMKTTLEHPSALGIAAVGTVVAHTAEPGRTGSDLTSVTWTSPVSGTVRVLGGVWRRDGFDRPQTWALHVDGAALTTGPLVPGDGFTQAAPFTFDQGSGGASAVEFAAAAGDVIELRLRKDNPTNIGTGDLIGVDLSIVVDTQQGP